MAETESEALKRAANWIPFVCHICDNEFYESQGGICARCGELACGNHLFMVNPETPDLDVTRMYYCCSSCLTKEDDAVPFAAWRTRHR